MEALKQRSDESLAAAMLKSDAGQLLQQLGRPQQALSYYTAAMAAMERELGEP